MKTFLTVCVAILLATTLNPIQAQDELALLEIWQGHTSAIEGLEISPDGQVIASWDADRSIRLWDAESGAERAVLTEHDEVIRRIVFSPDGRWLASRSDSELLLWNIETNSLHAVLPDRTDFIYSANFSPDSQTLVSLNSNYIVKVWDVASGTLRFDLPGNDGYGFSPDSTLLATAGDAYHREGYLWNLMTGEQLAILPAFGYGVAGVSFSADGTQLLTYGGRAMQRWDVATGQLETEYELENFVGTSLNFAMFSPDQTFILSRHQDADIRLWDAASGEEIRILMGFTGYVERIFFTPDGATLIAYDKGIYGDREHPSEIRTWDVKTWQPTDVMRGHTTWIDSVAMNRDGTRLVSASEDNTLRVWDIRTGEEIAHFIALSSRAVFADSRIISAVGRVIAVYGVPDSDHPALPYVFVPGEVLPSSINVRSAPSTEAAEVGYAVEGVAMVGAISPAGDFVYLPEYGGWARFDPQYVQVENVDWLPIVATN